MHTVNMLNAKTNLSKLVEQLESEEALEIIIARNGKPAAKLVRFTPKTIGKRIGIAKGHFKVPDSIDADNETIAKLFSHGKP